MIFGGVMLVMVESSVVISATGWGFHLVFLVVMGS